MTGSWRDEMFGTTVLPIYIHRWPQLVSAWEIQVKYVLVDFRIHIGRYYTYTVTAVEQLLSKTWNYVEIFMK